MRASFRAGGTSAAAMRCASPSTMAVFPTPALPISAGLFLLWRSRMSTARAISASRQRTGSRSPRRAWAVRSMPMRSSSALPPESNSPSNGSPIQSPRPQEPQIPVDDGIAEHEHDGRAHGEEYPERDVTLLPRSRSGTYTRLPNTAAPNTVNSTPFQPTNAPTISIILMSPPPIASSLNSQRPTTPTAYSRANPVAAPSTASLNPGTPAVSEAPSPMMSPAQLYSSGIR